MAPKPKLSKNGFQKVQLVVGREVCVGVCRGVCRGVCGCVYDVEIFGARIVIGDVTPLSTNDKVIR